MTWTEIINSVRNVLQESGTDFYNTEYLKLYGLKFQQRMAEECPGLFLVKRTLTTVASTEEYTVASTIGPDVQYIIRAVWDDEVELVPMEYQNIPLLGQSGTPSHFWLRGNYIGFYPKPDAVKSISFFGYRTPPLHAMTIIHDAGASSTAATVTIASGTMSLTITGGTNAGTDAIVLTAVANDTIAELVAVINALGKGWTAARSSYVPTTETSANLEDISATSCWAVNLNLYENPESPAWTHKYFEDDILAKAFEEAGETTRAQRYEQKSGSNMQHVSAQADKRSMLNKMGAVADVYDCGGAPNIFPAPGGWWVRIP